ncbi:MAG: nicotinate phosphoribosyltransferase [Actinomycetota bacterium]
MPDRVSRVMLIDLYELTMAASYHHEGLVATATFDLFVRELPERRNFLIACGLEQLLEYLEGFSFEEPEIDYLRSLELFDEAFLTYLSSLRFTGEVWAVPEGEAVFAGEPLVRVTAPLIEAQLIETFVINCIAHQTMVASKAARVSIACEGKDFVDFSARRDHGFDAALYGARAAFVGGAAATSNVAAGMAFDIPLSGTMAHSYIMAHDNEEEAFRCFLRRFPDNAVLLIDTFDVIEGARKAIKAAKELEPHGVRLRGVRIDSGDLALLTQSVRELLDDAGLNDVQIFLSGDLDEYVIDELLARGVPADAFGVGTQLGTSADAPALGAVYKLVEDETGPKVKLSTGKATLPGRKQIYRLSRDGRYEKDVLALADEEIADGAPLLQRIMADGQRLLARQTLPEIQERCRASLTRLPAPLRSLRRDEAGGYVIERSEELERMRSRMSPE